ncbi:MAG: 3-oxoacyl-ACP synthase [Acidobacteriota bacterium]|nr:3-oxoacyl-ACP synthase [Acidobacteriota bacterium]
MGTRIEALATAVGGRRLFAPGARRLADTAARQCLERAGRNASEVGLLVNTGLYHDRNMGEPAVASLIQEDIGANPGHPPTAHRGTFSFDLYNGACGVLTALSLLDALLASGTIGLGMVVAGDADPAPRHSRGVWFSPAGGAVLVHRDHTDGGLGPVHLDTFPEHAGLLRSSVRWETRTAAGDGHGHGRNVLTIDRDPAFAEQALECAERSVRAWAEGEGTALATVDLLVAAGPDPDFASALASRLGMESAAVVGPEGPMATAHTAAMIGALEAASLHGWLPASRKALLVSAAAGVTVASALYRA